MKFIRLTKYESGSKRTMVNIDFSRVILYQENPNKTTQIVYEDGDGCNEVVVKESGRFIRNRLAEFERTARY